jgi:hypothetical protein
VTWYADADDDGHAGEELTWVGCEQPAGFAPAADDCNDLDPAVHPGATEICSGRDEDCNGVIDDVDEVDLVTGTQAFDDRDGDGFGDPTTGTWDCTVATDRVLDATDCDDDNPAVHPDATEICANGVDDNCSGDAAPCDLAGEHLAEDLAFLILSDPSVDDPVLGLIVADIDGDSQNDLVVLDQGNNAYDLRAPPVGQPVRGHL